MATREKLLNDGGASAGKPTASLYISAIIGSVQAAQYGFNVGVINAPQQVISDALSIDAKGPAWSVGVVASFCIAGFAAAQVSGGLADSLGRKRYIVLLNLVFLLAGGAALASSLLASSSPTAAYWLLVLSRIAGGLGSGAGSVVTPMYLGEIATTDTKGAFGALNQFQIVTWILIAQLMGLGMATTSLWGPMFALPGVLAAIGLLGAAAMVESPRWLASRGKRDEARKVLLALRGYDEADADSELAEAEEAAAGSSAGGMSVSALLADKSLRKPLIVAVMLQLSQQFSGINAVFYYSTSFFSDAGVSGTTGTVLAGAVNVVATAAAIPLIERLGRKPPLLLGAGGMLLSAAALTGALVAKDAYASASGPLGDMSIVFVLLFVTFFEFGLGAIPWNIAGEMFPDAPRATAIALAAAANWTANTAVGIVFPLMQSALGNYSFAPFAAWLALAFAFTLVAVPETKGKTPEQVLRWFNSGYGRPGDDVEGAV